ncbi:MAG: hypothetical protein ABIG89_04425 [Candidatus Woesearchaeota archaeon]
MEKKRGLLLLCILSMLLLFLSLTSIISTATINPKVGDAIGGKESSDFDSEQFYGSSLLELGLGFECVRNEINDDGSMVPILGYPIFKEMTVSDYDGGFLKNFCEGSDECAVDTSYNAKDNTNYWTTSNDKIGITYFKNENDNVGIRSDKKNMKNFIYEGFCKTYVKGQHYLYHEYHKNEDGSNELKYGGPISVKQVKNCEDDNIDDLSASDCVNTPDDEFVNYYIKQLPQYEEGEILNDYSHVYDGKYEYEVDWESYNDGVSKCLGKHLNIDYPSIDNVGKKFNNFWNFGPDGKEAISQKDECCGDDYLWIMNGVNDYDGKTDGKTVDELCLYGYEDVKFTEAQSGQTSSKVGNHPYRNVYCTPNYLTQFSGIHSAYDTYINDFDPEAENQVMNLFQAKYGDATTTTDVGVRYLKMNDVKGKRAPLYCHHFFNQTGDNFEWLFGHEAGEIHYFGVDANAKKPYTKDNVPYVNDNKFKLNPMAPDYIYDIVAKYSSADLKKFDKDNDGVDSDDLNICNLYLGGTWTGHHCCGGKFAYNPQVKVLENFHDTADDGEHYVLSKDKLKLYSLNAEVDGDDVWKMPNKACYMGEAVGHGEVKNVPASSYMQSVSLIYISNNIFTCQNFIPAPQYPLIELNIIDGSVKDQEQCCFNVHGDKGAVVPKESSKTTNDNNNIQLHIQCYPPSFSILNDKGELQLCSYPNAPLKDMGYTYAFSKISDKNYNPLSTPNNQLFIKNSNNVHNHCDSFYLLDDYDMWDGDAKFAYCMPNNTWVSMDIYAQPDESDSVYQMLGRYPSEYEKLKESEVPDDLKSSNIISDKGCCIEGDCWDGSKCVANGETKSKGSGDAKKIYLCANSKWELGEASYNWYGEKFGGETDPKIVGLQYCIDDWSCACPESKAYSLNDEDQREIDICEKYTQPNSLCTREPAMFIGDRFCEPTYSGSNFKEPKTAKWSSRTKYLAFALWNFAVNEEYGSPDDFVLHCDTPEYVLNQYNIELPEELFVDENDYNNFCVLKFPDAVYIGTTLNPRIDYDTIPEILYNQETIDPFSACSVDADCPAADDGMSWKGYTCYKAPAYSKGTCVANCIDNNDCSDNEECAHDKDDDGNDIDPGSCIPNAPKTVDMHNMKDLGKLFYGESDAKGILNSEYLFNLITKVYNEKDCKTTISETNPGGINFDTEPFISFKKCENDHLLYNNYTNAIIFSNSSIVNLGMFYTTVVSSQNAINKHVKSIKSYQEKNKDIIAQTKDMSIISAISDFDRLYYAKHLDNSNPATPVMREIFGIVERKSDSQPSSSDLAGKVKYFYAINYTNVFDGSVISCDTIKEAAPELICHDSKTKEGEIGKSMADGNNNYAVVIAPTMSEYDSDDEQDMYVMKYWQDLTAKIRYAET